MLGLLSILSGAACASPAPAAWKETAGAARYLAKDQIAGTERGLGKLSAADRGKVETLLTELAAQQPGVEGLKRASELLAATLPLLSDPRSDLGGDSPALATAKSGALAVLQGLALKSGQAVAAGPDASAKAAEALRAVRGIAALDAGARAKIEEELGYGLGGELVVAALKAVGP